MMTLNRILCPVDFSEPSKRALRHALAIARWHEAAISVLHVEHTLLHAASLEVASYPDPSERHSRELSQFIADAGGNSQTIEVHLATGDAVSMILEHAARDASDLIVMGTNGRSGLSRAVLGSVTERVTRESLVPVLTIPPAAQIQAASDLPPFDPILCASDFSPACRRALDLAILMGQEADARLVLLHALQLPDAAALTPIPSPLSVQIDFAELRNDALVRLKNELPADAGFRCRPDPVVVRGRPADVILEMAHREDIKLIVMGVQSRGALDRLLFGSTTRRVMQMATCPVLSIRASQAEERRPAWLPPEASVAKASMAASNV